MREEKKAAPAAVAGPMPLGGFPVCGCRSCVARQCSLVHATSQMSPVAQGDAEDAARYRWLRARWGRIADEYDGDSDQLVAIRESDSHFEGWDVDPVTLDRAIDAARSQAKAKEGGA